MDILIDSVNKLETILEHSGCEEVGVLLDVNPDAVNCQFERGACMTASFGGRSAEFVTSDPIRAQTKISFMFGAPLDTPPVRSAACAMINVATGFFCLSRVLHACPGSRHADCMKELSAVIQGKKILCVGSIPAIENAFPSYIVTNDKDADLVLVNAEGITDPGLGDLIAECKDTKRIICLGPSTAGVARLQQLEHWCPYGTSV
ncbi:MAG: hypothetical protein CVV30_07680 [Methanomicrobiales archaeon HGW-Methanomicrobiales-1]|jgi:hypothetical protein|nr:MAG: hypothetical protein CVV30_07680 [Methanomicrobiales archaeon HGW-Methanomicrobiales-1]